ncbi:MAG: response regulator transcription factor [Clostridia bacterium]|nr:response regulator transcription factor [Clostridia bacterium]
MARIFIVEDDPMISEIVEYNLAREGFETSVSADGEEGLQMILEGSPDLVLLDVMLPSLDGFEILRRVRRVSSVPIIMMTAREGEDDRVDGLELGADDYIVKPFSMRELISRVRANLRRASGELGRSTAAGGLAFDDGRAEATVNGRRLELSTREYSLLKLLADSPGRVYSRDELLEKVWGYSYDGGTRVVDVAVRRLREKLEECLPGAQKYVSTRHGLGYYFPEDEQ